MLNRRKFVAALLATTMLSTPSEAWRFGQPAPSGKSVLNGFQAPDLPFKNLILSGSGAFNAGYITNANGYPTDSGFLNSSNVIFRLPYGYFGSYRMSWTGSTKINPNMKLNLTTNPNSNYVSNFIVGTLTSPGYIEFDLSTSVVSIADSGVSNGVGGTLIQVTFASRDVIQGMAKITGAGGGANGTWQYNQVSATAINLLGSTFTSTAGAAGTVVFSYPSAQLNFSNTGTFTGFGSLVMCMSGTSPLGTDHSGDWAAIQTGDLSQMFNQDFLNLYSAIRPGVIRFLDAAMMNSCTNSRSTYRTPVGYITYGQVRYLPNLWAGVTGSGAISSGGAGKVYTCSAATDTPGGSYVDGEIIQGILDAVPVTMAITGAASGTGGRIRLQVADTSTLSNGQRVAVRGYNNVSGYAAGNGNGLWTITVIDGTHVELTSDTAGNPSVFVNAWSSGGFISVATLNVATKGAKLLVGSIGQAPTYSNSYDTSSVVTCIYNAILDAIIVTTDGLTRSWPLEVMVACCNKLNAHYWHQFPHLFNLASVTADTTYIAANLRSTSGFYPEVSNELWNAGFQQTGLYFSIARCWNASNAVTFGLIDYVALQHRRFMGAVTTAWGGRSGLVRVLPWQAAGWNSVVQTNLYNGASLNGTTYPLYAAAGNSNYDTAPNRPRDFTEAYSYAGYWSGGVVGPHGLDTTHTFSSIDLNGLTGAADNYALGTANGIAASNAWFDNDNRQGTYNTQAIASVSSGNTFNINGHPFANNDVVAFSLASGGTFYSAGANINTLYYVVNKAANSFQLSLTQGGAAITGVTGGSGVQIGFLGGETLLYLNSIGSVYYQPYANAAQTDGKKIVCYEGGCQSGPAITTSQCTSVGISTTYGGTDNGTFGSGGLVYNALYGYKNSSLFQATCSKQWTDQQGWTSPASNFWPAWYTSSGANGSFLTNTTNLAANYPWAMMPTDLYGSPQVFKSYDSLRAFNA